jgi:hypothetical protein
MKIKSIVTGVTLCAALAAVNGCKKEEPAVPQAPKAGEGGAVSKATEAVDGAKTAVKQVADQATTQVKAVEQQAQALIDRAKGLVTEQKYQEALGSLGQLSNLKLTPEQQKLVDDLKAQIQSALAKAIPTNAASALGGALGGKK